MRRGWWWLLAALLLAACGQGRETAAPSPYLPTVAAAANPGGATATLPPPQQRLLPTPTTPPPALVGRPLPSLARELPLAAQWTTYRALQARRAPVRDDEALAAAYRGYRPVPPAPLAGAPLPLGSRDTVTITRFDDRSLQPITVQLLAVGNSAYFWFESGAGTPSPSSRALQEATAAFDVIYEEVRRAFGAEASPGVDGDPRIHIIHATPRALCGAASCSVAGYFSARDALPAAAAAGSNQREMFVMSGANFGTSFYFNVLAHEFRHMVEHAHDRGDDGWVVEGSAMLAEVLLGYQDNARSRANLFLSAPERSLVSWPTPPAPIAYGHGYLFNQYLYDRLGPAAYRAFAIHPDDGLAALDGVAADRGLDVNGMQLWQDWLAALALLDAPLKPARYEISLGGLLPVARAPLGAGSRVVDTVGQFGARYYEIGGDRPVTLTFSGSTQVPLLNTLPPGGSWMWVTQRANYQDARLTRSVDLGDVSSATLSYDVFYDIEAGFDFGYVAVSADGGAGWTPLVADGMAGAGDDPGGRALTGRFYTGAGSGWRRESIDLTPWGGQEILLRFQYVTDQLVTGDGLALDNITIPEIGFSDGVEQPAGGWIAEGFLRAPGYIPQTWSLQLITFGAAGPSVTAIPLPVAQSATFAVDPAAGTRPPILIVAATAPQTLQQAHFTLRTNP